MNERQEHFLFGNGLATAVGFLLVLAFREDFTLHEVLLGGGAGILGYQSLTHLLQDVFDK